MSCESKSDKELHHKNRPELGRLLRYHFQRVVLKQDPEEIQIRRDGFDLTGDMAAYRRICQIGNQSFGEKFVPEELFDGQEGVSGPERFI